MSKETEPKPNPLEMASDAVNEAYTAQEEVFYNAMVLGLILSIRQDIRKEIKPKRIEVTPKVLATEPVEPNKWHKIQENKNK